MRKCPACNSRGFKQEMYTYGSYKSEGNALRGIEPQKCKRITCLLCKGRGKINAERSNQYEQIKRAIAFWKKRKVLT